MSKKNKSVSQEDINNFNQQHKENSDKVSKAGITVGRTSGMGKDNYFFHKGIAYDSHSEAVEDIVKRENL